MLDLLVQPSFYLALLSVTVIQIALGADNLIIITIIANKLPQAERKRAIQWGLGLAMIFRILLLMGVSLILQYATTVFWKFDGSVLGLDAKGAVSGKAAVLFFGGLFLIWKGVKELRVMARGVHEVAMPKAHKFSQVVATIVGLNLLFSIDSILTVVGMTDVMAVMIGSVLISVALMLAFAGPISDFLARNPDFEILGLFVLLLIGFVLVLEGGHVAKLEIADTAFPYIPQWIVIFILLLMFAVDLFQNWLARKQKQHPVELHHRTK